jgi:hypothetical protein
MSHIITVFIIYLDVVLVLQALNPIVCTAVFMYCQNFYNNTFNWFTLKKTYEATKPLCKIS